MSCGEGLCKKLLLLELFPYIYETKFWGCIHKVQIVV
jgi:hypothetical protein